MQNSNTLFRANEKLSLNRAIATPRDGFTLIELMVVLLIIVTLSVSVLTVARTSTESRRIREAARSISTALAQAKSRAIETGRPHGIWLERFDNGQRNVVRQIFFAEVPAPYAGDSIDARASFKIEQNIGIVTFSGVINSNMVQKGDFIRFDYRGLMYQITESTGQGYKIAPNSGRFPPPGGNSPFQVFRKPRKASEKPIRFPGDAVIDLTRSGFGDNDEFSAGNREVIIMFSPSGGLDRVYYTSDGGGNTNSGGTNLQPRRTIQPIYLLVGKNQKMGDENLKDPDNLYITIGPTTGLVSTSRTSKGNSSVAAREGARTMQGLGGR